MTRTVADAAILLGALAGVDPEDPATASARIPADYTATLDRAGARGKRIGVLRPGWMGPAVKPSYEAAIDALRALGAVVVDVEPPKPRPEAEDAELTVLLCELKADLPAYLARRGHPTVRTLEDVLRFDAAHAAEELAIFGHDLFEKAAAKGDLASKEYTDALALCRRSSRDEGLDRLLAAQSLDAIAAPTGGPAWLTDYVNGDSFTGSGYDMAAVAGYPSVTVPSGATRGLPLGVCFMGAAWSEPTLLAIAFAFEQETRHRRPPTYAPTSDYGLP